MQKINLKEKFSLINDHWNPRVAGKFNGQEIRLAKFKGEFSTHKHVEEDELFLVIKGTVKIVLQEKVVELNEGEILIVPKGRLHKPIAVNEAEVLMIAMSGSSNTGDISNEFTRSKLESI